MRLDRSYLRPLVVIALSLTGLVLVGFATLGATEISCGGCHEPHAAALQTSVHTPLDCAECHAPLGGAMFGVTDLPGMYVAQALQGDLRGPAAETRSDTCLECHEGVTDIVTDGNSGIRIQHETCAVGPTCDTCHSTVAHGDAVRWPRAAIMEDCTGCHSRVSASLECDTCHAGKIDKDDRLRSGPWQVTHGANWRQTHGMGDLASCMTCHPENYCVDCHGLVLPHPATFGREHGSASLAPEADCEGCHRSTRFCDACHGTEMPHPEGFLEVHSTEAGSLENPACTRCHAPEDCVACHVRHIHPGGATSAPGVDLGSGGAQ